MPEQQVLALVGATGGAGTTRLAVEAATLLARHGHDVAVLDAAYATQGLSQYLPGRLDPDVTELCLSEEPLAAGLVDLPVETPGRVACCPAFAPFERLARAKTPEAARAFEQRVAAAAGWFDYVLLDVPPVAANQAVAACHAADRRALVAPTTGRGIDALPRMADRLADIDAPADLHLLNRGDEPTDAADLVVPDGGEAVACATGTGEFHAAVAAFLEMGLGVELEFELAEEGGRFSRLLG